MRYGVLVSINRGNRQCNVVKSYSITTSTTIVVAYARKSATPRCTHKIWMEREKAETQRALSLWKYVLCCLVANVTIDVLVVWLFFRRTIRPKKGNLVYQYTFYTSRYFHMFFRFSRFFSLLRLFTSCLSYPAQWTCIALQHNEHDSAYVINNVQYLCCCVVVLWPQSLLLSFDKNRYGHWLRWVSTVQPLEGWSPVLDTNLSNSK